MTKKRIIAAKKDKKGNIIAVKGEGNKRFYNKDQAIKLAEKGVLDLVVVNPSNKDKHIRTPPNKKVKDNLDNLPSS
ncbi:MULTISPECIES: DUF3892 domain-containing protein [Pseudoalteromonas]|uniref:DUF3892 domain-containing protein n=1 Tax=Pseudoalteromonas TaxID=53246 RepID=UPI00078126BD|nr:DUF3892 domain-containing protein [Pseudoalteromonas shioyasakiensis]